MTKGQWVLAGIGAFLAVSWLSNLGKNSGPTPSQAPPAVEAPAAVDTKADATDTKADTPTEAVDTTPEPVADIPPPAASETPAKSPAASSSQPTMKSNIIGCQHLASEKKLIDYASNGDTEAFGKYGVAAIATGECATFHAGESVFASIPDGGVFANIGFTAVRRRGEVVEYVVPSDSVTDF